MTDFLGPFMRSLGFLTRLPIKSHWFLPEKPISTDAHYFPIAGLLIGLLSGCCLALARLIGFDIWVSAIFCVSFTIILTGALHEDGLADVADAFFVSKSPENRLTIMKDSRIGTYGTLALIFSVFSRIAFIASIEINHGLYHTIIALIVSEAVSRGGMVWFWTRLPLARKNGTAAAAGEPAADIARKSLIISAIILLVGGIISNSVISMIISIAVLFLFIYLFSLECQKRIGGYTGDTLGAVEQCLALILLAIASLGR